MQEELTSRTKSGISPLNFDVLEDVLNENVTKMASSNPSIDDFPTDLFTGK